MRRIATRSSPVLFVAAFAAIHKTHYGWIRIATSEDPQREGLIHDWANESIPGKPTRAGQSPEPRSVSLLLAAMTILALRMWRTNRRGHTCRWLLTWQLWPRPRKLAVHLLVAMSWLTTALVAGAVEYALTQVAGLVDAYGFQESGGRLYFNASDETGRRLFSTDGTRVTPAADITADRWTHFAEQYYFSGRGANGSELYRTDGTNFEEFADIFPGPHSSQPGNFLEYDGNLFFAANNGSPYHIHKTDGQEVVPITGANSLRMPVIFDGTLVSSAYGPNGDELYRFDGTTFVEIADILPGVNESGNPASSSPTDLTVAGDWLYFKAIRDSTTRSRSLFKTDGEKVSEVIDLGPPPFCFCVYDLFEFQGELFFSIPAAGGLFKTDGNTVTQISDVVPVPSLWLAGNEFFVFRDAMYFTSAESLYKYDGKTVAKIADVASNGRYVEFHDELYFGGTEFSVHGLYKWDGTNVTEVGVDALPADVHAIDFVAEFNEELYFRGASSDGLVLYKTDGEAITQIADASPTFAEGTEQGVTFLGEFHQTSRALFFVATSESDVQLLATDGESLAAFDVNPNRADFVTQFVLIGGPILREDLDFAVYQDELYFNVLGTGLHKVTAVPEPCGFSLMWLAVCLVIGIRTARPSNRFALWARTAVCHLKRHAGEMSFAFV